MNTMSDAERVTIALHQSFLHVVQRQAVRLLADAQMIVPAWIDLPVSRRRCAIEVIANLLDNGTIRVGPGRSRDSIAPKTMADLAKRSPSHEVSR